MNYSWTHRFKLLYRKEPISSFVLLFGAADAVIGGVAGQWSLMALGLGAAAAAVVLRWRLALGRSSRSAAPEEPIRYRPSRPLLLQQPPVNPE